MANAEYDANLHQEFQSRQRSPSDSGFECEFVDQPPRRSQCPICLLVPRDPHQTPCCGNAFCKNCIRKISEKYQPCPTCKTDDFSSYPDKGLQQELYNSKVYCPKRSLSCDWQGELRELDKHLDGDGTNVEGCKFVTVICSFCSECYPRGKLKEHQKNECTRRPFTCTTCNDYTSTYEDVLSNHQSSCKCRPVDCPNKCGQVVQNQKLEEHLSSECELSEVECEFSHAGCEVKVLRKDLPSHMSENMTTHLSLLARENRRLKLKLEYETKELKDRIAGLETERHHCTYNTTLYFIYPLKEWTDETSRWNSAPFFYNKSHSLQLCVWCIGNMKELHFYFERIHHSPCTLFISTSIKDADGSKTYFHKVVKCTGWKSETVKISGLILISKIAYAFYDKREIPIFIDSVEEIKCLN